MRISLGGYAHHIPDKEVKALLPNTGIRIGGFFPDGAIRNGNNFLVFEYENSSRGLLSHVAKYQYYCDSNPEVKLKVIVIESLFHQKTHSQDTALAKFISKHDIKNLKFKFCKCDGTERNIKSIVRKALKEFRIPL